MDLVVTVAGPLSDSYLTVAAADVLATDDLGPEAAAWRAATLETKETALRRATREVDGYVGTVWTPYTWGQALLFPRASDFGGSLTVPVPIIPRGITLATYAQAKFVVKNASVIDAAHTRRARELQSASEPNTSYSRSDEPDSDISSGMLKHLHPFLRSGTPRGISSVRMDSGYVG